jgi:1,4-alpha-glucan branching enzyme
MGEFVGEFCLVLHAHLPWVLNHGIWPHGTNWVYEAAAETYIPILMECDKLMAEGYAPKFTIDITPVLCEMLANEKFKEGFIEYCDGKVSGAQADLEEFKNRGDIPKIEQTNFINMANFWIEFYTRTKRYFIVTLNKEILSGFKKLQDMGHIDITTCAATHGYAPLLSKESSIHGQFKTAVNNYKKHFGIEPMGTWIAECAYRPGYDWKKPIGTPASGYRPGVEKFLSRNGLKYFFVDSPLLMGGVSQGVYAGRFPLLKQMWDTFQKQYKEEKLDFNREQYEPYIISTKDAKNPVAFFTRDENTGLLVWSGEHGYPATGGAYLDFHKKHYKDSFGGGSGLRYWKITSPKADMGSKMQYYMPDIEDLLNQNAGHYKEAIKGVLKQYKARTGQPGLLVAPYDAELFGHWWFEGPWFINRVIRFAAMDPEVKMTTCKDYLVEHGMPNKVVSLVEGSWGQGSSHWIWFNDWCTWTWEKIYEIEPMMEQLVAKYINRTEPEMQRLLKQLARENLIMQASDWQFLISTWSARDYAENRFTLHFENCKRLGNMIDRFGTGQKIDDGEWEFLARLEDVDDIFEEIDISAWLPDEWKEKD